MHRPHPDFPTRTPEGQAWLRDHPDVDPDELEHVWRMAEHARVFEEDSVPIDADRRTTIQATLGRLDDGPAAPSPAAPPIPTPRADRPGQRRKPLPRGVHIAAVVVLLLGAGLGWWLRPITHTAAPGSFQALVLPDGSRIELNNGASLSYQRTFGLQTRTVRLTGEAFFDVARGATPFTVRTFNARVTVQGTRFNVQAWPSDPDQETTVVLEEGRVEVAAARAPDQATVLAAGQMSRVGPSEVLPSAPVAADVARALAWRTGGLAFSNQPLHTLFAALERRFAVRIDVRSPGLRSERFSLFVARADSLEVLLDMICTPLGCTYHATPQGYEILGPDPS